MKKTAKTQTARPNYETVIEFRGLPKKLPCFLLRDADGKLFTAFDEAGAKLKPVGNVQALEWFAACDENELEFTGSISSVIKGALPKPAAAAPVSEWPSASEQARNYDWVKGWSDLRVTTGVAYIDGVLHWVKLHSFRKPQIDRISHWEAAKRMGDMLMPEIEFDLDVELDDEGNRQWFKDLRVLLAGVQESGAAPKLEQITPTDTKRLGFSVSVQDPKTKN